MRFVRVVRDLGLDCRGGALLGLRLSEALNPKPLDP